MTEASEATLQLLQDLTAPITKAADLDREFRALGRHTAASERGYLSECPNDDCRPNNQAEPLCFSFADIGEQIVGHCFAGCNNAQSVAIYPTLQLRAQWLEAQWNKAANRAMTDKALEALPLPKSMRAPEPETQEEVVTLETPQQAELCGPWLREQTLSMVHAWRGAGKSWFAMYLAYCVATGRPFMRWVCTEPRRVLYVDGEMGLNDTKGRLTKIIQAEEHRAGKLESKLSMFRASNLAQFPRGLPKLNTTEGQALIEAAIAKGSTLLVLDNLSCLFRVENPNDAAAWDEILDWWVSLRIRGHSVLVVQHTGKSGLQRASSHLEDPLDNVIALKQPTNYKAEDGAAFVLKFEKSRGVHGPTVADLEAKLTEDSKGFLEWAMSTREPTKNEQIEELLRSGVPVSEVAKMPGFVRSQVYKVNAALKPRSGESPAGGCPIVLSPLKGGEDRTMDATHPKDKEDIGQIVGQAIGQWNKKASLPKETAQGSIGQLRGQPVGQGAGQTLDTLSYDSSQVQHIVGQNSKPVGQATNQRPAPPPNKESDPPPDPAITEELFDLDEGEGVQL